MSGWDNISVERHLGQPDERQWRQRSAAEELQAMYNSAGTINDITRSAYPWWRAVPQASTGAITREMLDNYAAQLSQLFNDAETPLWEVLTKSEPPPWDPALNAPEGM